MKASSSGHFVLNVNGSSERDQLIGNALLLVSSPAYFRPLFMAAGSGLGTRLFCYEPTF